VYDSTYSDDWTELTRDEAVERAYALGVAAACGHDNREEYESIKAAAASNYDGSLIELSFDQGRSDALELEASGATPRKSGTNLSRRRRSSPQAVTVRCRGCLSLPSCWNASSSLRDLQRR